MLLIILLNVRVDGVLITLTDALGDGSVGDAFVTPGTHTITISNAADTEVLAETTVDCPECNAVVAPTPTPAHRTAPPTDIEAGGPTNPSTPVVPVLFLLAALGAGVYLVATRKRV